MAEHDSQKIIAVLENPVADLQKQLERSNDRETALIDEKAKRLDLLSAEKEEKRARMPPPEEKEKSRNWLLRRVGARSSKNNLPHFRVSATLLKPVLGGTAMKRIPFRFLPPSYHSRGIKGWDRKIQVI